MNKLIRYLNESRTMFHFSDRVFIKHQYKKMFGKEIDLENPKTFNEKVNWLKLYDRKDIYTKMVDKYEAKKYVSDLIGDEYIVPTIGVWDSIDEIDFSKLPNKFVMKCTHDSGGLYICKDKSKINLRKLKLKFKLIMKRNFYYRDREWPYKNVKPRIIVEELLEDKNSNSLSDYKFFCFNGEPKLMYMSIGLENHETASMSFYDMNFELTDCKRKDYKKINFKPNKPVNFEKMIKLSKILSKNIPHLRVDWYEVNGKLYFGELTFSTCGGFVPFEDEKWDIKLGNMLVLPNINNTKDGNGE